MKNIIAVKKAFPIFNKHPDLVYLDSAATSLKPKTVIDESLRYYHEYSANVGRSLYPIAEEATIAYENAREKVAQFLGADEHHGVVFTANATHALNLVALGLEELITPPHSILTTTLEHHSNYLPWKELAKRTGARFVVAPFDSSGRLVPEEIAALVDATTAVVAFSAVSNVFGVINPVRDIVQAIRQKNKHALILVDACQFVAHLPIQLSDWDADFVVFSGHKLYSPTGIGVLAGKLSALEKLTPKNIGGGTVLDAWSEETVYRPLPDRLEGGTPNIAGAVGLGAAIDFVLEVGFDDLRTHELGLLEETTTRLKRAFGDDLHILGGDSSALRAGLIAFTLTGIHPHDLAQLLGEDMVCVRAGEQCAGPLHHALGIPATTRVSFSLVNQLSDIERLIESMERARKTMDRSRV